MVHNAGAEAAFNFKRLHKDASFQSPMIRFVFVSVSLKISTLITMELHNAKVVGGASVALMLSNRRRGNSL